MKQAKQDPKATKLSKAEQQAQANPVETPEEILAAAKKAKYDMLAFARHGRRVVAALASERYEWNRSKSTVDGRLMHYFRERGETLTGTLGKPNYENWKGLSYPVVMDDGKTIVRIPGNRRLQTEIERLKCIHQRITIEYLGKRYLTSRHYEKIYAIHPAPLGKDGSGKDGRRILEQAAGDAEKSTEAGK